MIKELIPVKFIPKVRGLGFRGCPTFYRVFKYFRKRWGYSSWIEKTGNEYSYKIYARGVFHRPIKHETNYPYCSTYCSKYETAEERLLEELIIIVEEIEN